MFTEHDVEMSFKDGYVAGYEDGVDCGYKDGIKESKKNYAKIIFWCIIDSLSLGFLIAISLCKFVPGFWEWTSRGLL